jgi:uncharacterized phage infection (PIP) family protein YhgE
MPQSQPRHAAPNPHKAIRTVRFWGAPVVITLGLMSALCALYLGGILSPTTRLRHFPIAIVNEDAGPTGAKIVQGLTTSPQLDKNKFDLRVVSHEDAKRLMDTAKVYGELLIPPTFSTYLREFGESSVTSVRANRPSATIWTNQRAGNPHI